MSSIFEDINTIAQLAGHRPTQDKHDDEDRRVFLQFEKLLGDIRHRGSYLLRDIIETCQNELDSRVTCSNCGDHEHGIFHRGEWECDECRKWS